MHFQGFKVQKASFGDKVLQKAWKLQLHTVWDQKLIVNPFDSCYFGRYTWDKG